MHKAKKYRGTRSKSVESKGLSVEDLPVLRRKRTLAFNRLAKVLDVAKSAQTNVKHLDNFFAHFSEIEKLVNNFEEAHYDILSVIDSESEDSEDVVRSKFDEHYFEILVIYRQVAGTTSNLNQAACVSSDVVKVKLPKINLPTFSGNIKSWPEFYDIFNSLIHENESLSDIERMHYLVSSLSGDALSLIRTFPVSGLHYTAAYDTLVNRYRDKRDLAFACWKDILDINFKLNSPHDFRRTLDTFNENLTILTRLGFPTENWDFVLCYHLLSKIDVKMRCAFEQSSSSSELPSYSKLKDFLYSTCNALVRSDHFSASDKHIVHKRPVSSVLLSGADTEPRMSTPGSTPQTTLSSASQVPSSAEPTYKCSFCGEGHSISKCASFCKMSQRERSDYAKQHHWCFNCLKPSHVIKDCRSVFKCLKCHQHHHTLLHLDPVESNALCQAEVNNQSSNCAQVSMMSKMCENTIVLLSTAKIYIRDAAGQFQSFRALVDTGSQAHFITDCAANRLGLHRTSTTRNIRGLGQAPAPVSGSVTLEIGIENTTVFCIEAITLSSICGKMPTIKLDKSAWQHLQNLTLADPECNVPGTIDVLLGAEIFSSLLLPGSISSGPQQPSAFNSIFGWLLLGNVNTTNRNVINTLFASEDDQLNEQIQQFWEIDNPPQPSSKLSIEEELCEQLYRDTVSRDPTGRYIVTLPFKEDVKAHTFPGSREVALKRFHSLESKLSRNPELRSQYSEFMAEYLKSGHMSLVPLNELNNGKFYIPHHCVLRPDSVTTKLRVVFDASAKDARGISLNDTLLIGPKLQANILDILCRFRIHPIVFTADMRQMYRQVLVAEEDRDYQRIFWRFSDLEPLHEYHLNTVTYGVSSAPFLACRTVQQLAIDDGTTLPAACRVLSADMYVDDVVSGCSTIEEAQQTKSEVISLLKQGQFELRKWASNQPELLADLPSEHCLTELVSLDIDQSSILKILGLKWNSLKDVFTFDVQPVHRTCTKRTILSELARIFDPLGFLSPLTFLAKSLVQKLWILSIGWDETPPDDIILQWKHYSDQVGLLKSIEIPRCIAVTQAKLCELHGFADSSEAGYGAVIYLRIVDIDDNIHTLFLCSKSRVAPTKRISLPRLELCAAVLLANLLKYVIEIYSTSLSVFDVYAWSDSTVALSWIKSPSYRWKTFIANRVSQVQEAVPNTHWNHVPTGENPADIASRGQFPADLIHNELWWAGPSWLSQKESSWPSHDSDSIPLENADVLVEERLHILLVHDELSLIDHLLAKFSSLRKIQRIVAYCMRFISKARNKHSSSFDSFITRSELHNALLVIVKQIQTQSFQNDITRLKTNKALSKSMRKLNPFLDDRGVLRVGGRLSRSGLAYEHKHPALLPRNSLLTYRIIEVIHRENCHPGVNTMHYLLTQQFWILSSKRAIRHCLSKCLRCFRTNPTPLEPFMSDLPATRVNQVKPFSIVGVDYGGPFRIKLGPHRSSKVGKAYLCLFVCFTTKALHLEAVSDLSSDAFIAALRRIVGRRGRLNIIYSDCGTNFVGASNQLNQFMKTASHANQIDFRFNPPASPHFGGVWEIQIKAVKTHLYRIVGDQTLTFEELTTLFIQIESMLNSRPLCPLSSDPNDLSVLTPGHFLTLEPLTSVPDDDFTTTNITRLGRWQLIQRFQQDFWRRWKVEYLQALTQRAKWNKHCKALDVNSVVIVKSDNTVPLHWPLARVVELHPGPDDVVRIATVRTANGSLFKRPLTKLCPLPDQCD